MLGTNLTCAPKLWPLWTQRGKAAGVKQETRQQKQTSKQTSEQTSKNKHVTGAATIHSSAKKASQHPCQCMPPNPNALPSACVQYLEKVEVAFEVVKLHSTLPTAAAAAAAVTATVPCRVERAFGSSNVILEDVEVTQHRHGLCRHARVECNIAIEAALLVQHSVVQDLRLVLCDAVGSRVDHRRKVRMLSGV